MWSSRLVHELRLLLVAVQFLTRVPVPQWVGFEAHWLNECARHLPLVGAGIGAVGALVWCLAAQVWPPSVAVVLSMVATVWLTGAFHEDGLSDTCDALGGTVSRDKALLIMKDSRIGAYGAVSLVLMLGLKGVTLAGLAEHGLWWPALALIWAHAASRAVAVTLMRCLPYAGDIEHAKAKPLALSVRASAVWVAWCWVLLLTLGLVLLAPFKDPFAVLLPATLAAGLACALVTVVCARWYRQRLGGYTGDTLGAAQQLSEAAALLAWLAVVKHGAAVALGFP
ncbi:adenosylcobinamide-GDP ribazoletransferase [Aquabacterium sp. CECT 9606]|uniref:adenosylcobinamide-GDP ribazoletransferase n=1 Tax=Aquabacterium sp. CECT 9606 TaxID=2845822 RepID=UPI001E5510AA|nr:adenosylcobinamide-GDP ribazoletransferase [Aquabacterium sp. CECT 9606]CAH0354654.1 Adenosylcobinamide-GDP ribazoletransferase [Aquabacterium sp. CECT 9606]